MRETLNIIWAVLFTIFIMGLLMLIPYKKYQTAYKTYIHKYRSMPQERVNATYKYVDAVENGLENTSNGILTEPPKKYYSVHFPKRQEISHNTDNKYATPLYIRDKHNPYLWHRYRCK